MTAISLEELGMRAAELLEHVLLALPKLAAISNIAIPATSASLPWL